VSVLNTVAPPRSLTSMQPFFRELAVNRETALALLDGLTAAQLAWRPSDAQWGLAEICSHLATTAEHYVDELDLALARGHTDAAYSERPFRGTIVSRLIVWVMEPPVRIRMRSPALLRPNPTEAPLSARVRYLAAHRALEMRMERAAGLDLSHVRVRLPELRQVRLSLGAVLAMLLAHERRHLWQATVVRRSPSFPRPN
jgi:DinB superfamily